MVGREQPPRVRRARLRRRGIIVHDVPTESGELDSADTFGGGRPGLGKLPGDTPDLDDRYTRTVGKDQRHLENYPQLAADGICPPVGKRLRAVAGLQKKGMPTGHL